MSLQPDNLGPMNLLIQSHFMMVKRPKLYADLSLPSREPAELQMSSALLPRPSYKFSSFTARIITSLMTKLMGEGRNVSLVLEEMLFEIRRIVISFALYLCFLYPFRIYISFLHLSIKIVKLSPGRNSENSRAVQLFRRAWYKCNIKLL